MPATEVFNNALIAGGEDWSQETATFTSSPSISRCSLRRRNVFELSAKISTRGERSA